MATHELSRFKALAPVVTSKDDRQSNPDYQYWRNFQFPVTIKEYGAVTHVSFQPGKPNYFAVSASSRVQLYDPTTDQTVKTFSRFHDTVYSANFRSDGKLLITGNEDAQLRLFDVEGRVPLRIFKGHKRPVRVANFCCDLKRVFSVSDDKSLRIWDIASENMVKKYELHEDYARAACSIKSSADLLVTGSYDHTVKLVDIRTSSGNVVTMNHGAPVESVLAFPSGSILLSAGGNTIKIWDVLQGGKLVGNISHHHKTITCMSFNHDMTRLLSGGLDRHVKIYDIADYKVVHNIDYPGSILSLALSEGDKTLAVGMADKMLSIRHRRQGMADDEPKLDVKLKKSQDKLLVKSLNFKPDAQDVVIDHHKRTLLTGYEQQLKKFNHSKALDEAFRPEILQNHPEVTVAVIEELMRRKTINAALAGRRENQLIRILKFLSRHITNPSFSSVLIDVANYIVNIYAKEVTDPTEAVTNQFRRLKHLIKREREYQESMSKLSGCLEAIINSHSLVNVSSM